MYAVVLLVSPPMEQHTTYRLSTITFPTLVAPHTATDGATDACPRANAAHMCAVAMLPSPPRKQRTAKACPRAKSAHTHATAICLPHRRNNTTLNCHMNKQTTLHDIPHPCTFYSCCGYMPHSMKPNAWRTVLNVFAPGALRRTEKPH